MRDYEMNEAELYRFYRTGENGLSDAEAAQRLEKEGKNLLPDKKAPSVPSRILKQLADPMVLTLLGAAVLSAITSRVKGEGWTDVCIILAVVLLNTVLGVLQESKAEKALEALKKLSASESAVLRGGKVCRLPSGLLVPGDIVLLEAGDAVPADGRLLFCAGLKVEESALTGESVPSEKDASPIAVSPEEILPADRRCAVFMGSAVVSGRGRMLVTATGRKTEMGKIAAQLGETKKEQTPLQKRLSRLSKMLTLLVLIICAVMFGIGILKAGGLTPEGTLDTFMLAVSLAVAAIPEGLCAVVTVVLSMGVTRMSAKKAIVRKLTAVETLGCTQVICTDKTGTLTQNRMRTEELFGQEKMLLLAMALCNDAEKDGKGGYLGDPTEIALLIRAEQAGIDPAAAAQTWPRVGEIPFDSVRRRMTTVHRIGRGFLSVTKGAPDEILARSSSFYPSLPLDRERIAGECGRMAKQGLRVLAVGVRFHTSCPSQNGETERDLSFVGMCGLCDPIRPEVKHAVQTCHLAGIRPVMITGDHRDTAAAVAKQLGILREGDRILTGAELNAMSDEELVGQIGSVPVFARVSPDHKGRIVRAFRSKGLVTAMTGDGVNDAPAIRLADIGIGMGGSGTEVAKSAADLVLADDNFRTIVSAVGEGRRIYANIRRAVHFMLSSNLSEVLVIFTATTFGFTVLSPIHLLFINLITDSLPALALGTEPGEKELMHRPPRDPSEELISGRDARRIFLQGLLGSALTVAAYFAGVFAENGSFHAARSGVGSTMAFLTMSMAEIFHSVNMRSETESVFSIRTHNPLLLFAMLLSLALSLGVTLLPLPASLFGFTRISGGQALLSLLLAFLMIPAVEISKRLRRRFRRA